MSNESDATLVKAVSSKRNHFSTDGTPNSVFLTSRTTSSRSISVQKREIAASLWKRWPGRMSDDEFEEDDPKNGAKKVFDPLQPDLLLIPEAVASLGALLQVQDWQQASREKELESCFEDDQEDPSQQAACRLVAIDRYVKVTSLQHLRQRTRTQSHIHSKSVRRTTCVLVSHRWRLLWSRAHNQRYSSPPRSKPSPSKTSKPNRQQTSAPKPTANTNPWTLAGSRAFSLSLLS